MYLSQTNIVSTIYTIIHENILNNNNYKVSPNDITILGFTINQLKRFEAFYRFASGEKTKTMFETYEIMYLNRLNYYSNQNKPIWLTKALQLIKRDKDKYIKRGLSQLSQLFTIYDLFVEYPDKFESKMEWYCSQFNCTLNNFNDFLQNYQADYILFKNEVYHTDYSLIRKNKKLHFWMNSGTIKISTINSFKGWESELLFLIIEPKYKESTDFNLAFDELLYTGITRCRSNLVVINFGNFEYDKIIRPLIESVK